MTCSGRRFTMPTTRLCRWCVMPPPASTNCLTLLVRFARPAISLPGAGRCRRLKMTICWPFLMWAPTAWFWPPTTTRARGLLRLWWTAARPGLSAAVKNFLICSAWKTQNLNAELRELQKNLHKCHRERALVERSEMSASRRTLCLSNSGAVWARPLIMRHPRWDVPCFLIVQDVSASSALKASVCRPLPHYLAAEDRRFHLHVADQFGINGKNIVAQNHHVGQLAGCN